MQSFLYNFRLCLLYNLRVVALHSNVHHSNMLLVIHMDVTRGHMSYAHAPPIRKGNFCCITYIQVNSKNLPCFFDDHIGHFLKHLHQKGGNTVD